MPKHKFNIIDVIYNWVLIIGSYGVFYFTVSQRYPNSFNIKLSVFDSIYFSFVTITTLGYGDIIPLYDIAKIITICEVATGFIFIVLVF